MDNRLLMENYLLILKSTVEVYVHGTLESANNDIRLSLKEGLSETMEAQANTYDIMAKYGWYPVNNIEKKCINESLNKLEKQN